MFDLPKGMTGIKMCSGSYMHTVSKFYFPPAMQVVIA